MNLSKTIKQCPTRENGGRFFFRGRNGRIKGRGNLSICGRRSNKKIEGSPEQIVRIGKFIHECEDEMVFHVISLETSDSEKQSSVGARMIPHFNSIVYMENKKRIGKVDEVFGPINNIMFTVKPDPGILSKSFVKNDEVFIGTEKLIPISRFTDPNNVQTSKHNIKVVRKRRFAMNPGRMSKSNKLFGHVHSSAKGVKRNLGSIGKKLSSQS